MKQHYFELILAVIIGIFTVGCKGLSDTTGEMSTDSVAIKTVELGDTSFFPLTTGGKCDVVVNAHISYPQAFKDAQSTKTLQQLFVTSILGTTDSLPLEKSVADYVATVMHQYGISENERAEDIEDDYESVYQYSTDITISPIYNKNGILTFCKSENTTKNGRQTMSTHLYYNLDIEQMKQIELSDLFVESCYNDLVLLIKAALKRQLNAKTEDEVINQGYFNLDNMNVSNNFKIGDKGITWTYLPYEIALLSVGETNITVSYDELEMFLQDNKLVARIQQ
ncbi:MAG: RsiV family protein [Muribaculaceae bacterium]